MVSIAGSSGWQLAGTLVQESQRDAGQHEGATDAHLDTGQGGLQVQALRESPGALSKEERERERTELNTKKMHKKYLIILYIFIAIVITVFDICLIPANSMCIFINRTS